MLRSMPTGYRGRLQHLVGVSGGKDSTAVYLRALEWGRPFQAVFADTGNEHALTIEFIARLHERTGGPKIEVARADFAANLARHRDYVLREWPRPGIPEATVAEAAALHEPTGNPFLDLCISKDRFPQHIDRIERWEAVVSATSKRRSATFFPTVTDLTDADRQGTYARIRTLIEWSRTTRGGRQYDLFFDQQDGGGCTSDLALCEHSPSTGSEAQSTSHAT